MLGLPPVHVTTGRIVDGVPCRGRARGWVAVGDIATGVVLAVGGVALGGISVGGLAAGLLPIGGLSLGVAAVGGLAVGGLAAGGASIGWWAAFGGLALARDFAVSPREYGDAQLFGQSRTLRVKQLLGLESSMANPDLAAPNAAILPNRRFSCRFAGL